MKLGIKTALSTTLVAGVAIVGTGFSLNRTASRQAPDAAESLLVRRSVIKVHTDHGVITIPGTADSWTAADHAVFLADSIADFQVANSDISWRISSE